MVDKRVGSLVASYEYGDLALILEVWEAENKYLLYCYKFVYPSRAGRKKDSWIITSQPIESWGPLEPEQQRENNE